jgi:hypothetical protein
MGIDVGWLFQQCMSVDDGRIMNVAMVVMIGRRIHGNESTNCYE